MPSFRDLLLSATPPIWRKHSHPESHSTRNTSSPPPLSSSERETLGAPRRASKACGELSPPSSSSPPEGGLSSNTPNGAFPSPSSPPPSPSQPSASLRSHRGEGRAEGRERQEEGQCRHDGEGGRASRSVRIEGPPQSLLEGGGGAGGDQITPFNTPRSTLASSPSSDGGEFLKERSPREGPVGDSSSVGPPTPSPYAISAQRPSKSSQEQRSEGKHLSLPSSSSSARSPDPEGQFAGSVIRVNGELLIASLGEEEEEEDGSENNNNNSRQSSSTCFYTSASSPDLCANDGSGLHLSPQHHHSQEIASSSSASALKVSKSTASLFSFLRPGRGSGDKARAGGGGGGGRGSSHGESHHSGDSNSTLATTSHHSCSRQDPCLSVHPPKQNVQPSQLDTPSFSSSSPSKAGGREEEEEERGSAAEVVDKQRQQQMPTQSPRSSWSLSKRRSHRSSSSSSSSSSSCSAVSPLSPSSPSVLSPGVKKVSKSSQASSSSSSSRHQHHCQHCHHPHQSHASPRSLHNPFRHCSHQHHLHHCQGWLHEVSPRPPGNPFPLCVPLRNGVLFPLLGLGTYRLHGEECMQTVRTAAAIRHYMLIDTASVYRNEEEVGKALRDAAAQGLPWQLYLRDDTEVNIRCRKEASNLAVFITSKISPKDVAGGREHAYESILMSMKRLGIEQIDLYLIHWPGVRGHKASSRQNRRLRHECWLALEQLYKEKKVRAIGVSNFLIRHLEDLIEDGIEIVPMVNQIEFHPYCFDRDLVAWAKEHGMKLQAYASLGSGDLRLLRDATVLKIARECGVTASLVLLRWGLQHGCHLIPCSTKQLHLIENTHVFDFALDEDQMNRLDRLCDNTHFCWDPNIIA